MQAKDSIMVQLPRPQTQQAERCIEIMVAAMSLFISKNAGYGEPDGDDLGSAGQWADMHRKIKLIKRHLWDKEPWTHHEPFEQVCEELIGHLLLTIDFKERGL